MDLAVTCWDGRKWHAFKVSQYTFSLAHDFHIKRRDGAKAGIGEGIALVIYAQGPGFNSNTEKVKEDQQDGCEGKGKC